MASSAESNPGTRENLWSRRGLLSAAGWGSLLSCWGVGSIAFIRSLFPRVLFEPPTRWKAGYPSDYAINAVSTRWMDEYRCWIVREPDQIYALAAVCTHLGCTPVWLAGENKFRCPCHGSGFHLDGTNFEGPAPRPMERILVTLADDGQLVCDKAVTFRRELGEWGKPGSFVKYRA